MRHVRCEKKVNLTFICSGLSYTVCVIPIEVTSALDVGKSHFCGVNLLLTYAQHQSTTLGKLVALTPSWNIFAPLRVNFVREKGRGFGRRRDIVRIPVVTPQLGQFGTWAFDSWAHDCRVWGGVVVSGRRSRGLWCVLGARCWFGGRRCLFGESEATHHSRSVG